MAHGIRVWSSTGRVLLDTTLTTWNYITSGVVDNGVPASGDISSFGLVEAIVMQYLVNDSPSDQEGYAHSVSISPTYFSINGGNQRAIYVVLGR